MKKRNLVSLFLILCLALSGCSHNNSDADPEDILAAAFEKMNDLKGWKSTRKSEGTAYNLYLDSGQMSEDSESVTIGQKKDSIVYTLYLSEYDDYTDLSVTCYKELNMIDINGWIDDENCIYFDNFHNIELETGFELFSTDGVTGYYNPGYKFTSEKNENELIIYVETADSDKIVDLESQLFLKSDPDYNPLIAFNGERLTKRVYHSTLEYHIDKNGYITIFNADVDNDYGIGYDDYIVETEFSDYNETALDTKKLDELIEGVLSGDIEQYSDITEYIVWE